MNHIKIVCGELVVQVEFDGSSDDVYFNKHLLEKIDKCIKGMKAIQAGGKA